MAYVKKRLLLAGIPGFLAEELKEVFEKEDWLVYVPEGDLSGRALSDFFAEKLPNALIYRLEPERDDCIARLDRLLSYAMKVKVSRILLLEESGIFLSGLHETDPGEPFNQRDRRLRRMESLASIWRTNEKLSITLVPVPALYGKGQKPGDGLPGFILDDAFREEKSPILEAGAQYFLSARDAAYGLLQCILREGNPAILPLGPGTSFTWNEFSALVSPLLPKGITLPETLAPVRLPESDLDKYPVYGSAPLDGSAAQKELGWSSRADDREGLKNTVEEIIGLREKLRAEEKALQEKAERKARLERFVPFAENIAGFLIISIILGVRILTGSRSPFDFNYLYIGTMGLLYGKQQSFISFVLSMILLIAEMVLTGRDPFSILYDPMSFLHLISYFFVAVLTGYFADRKTYEKEAAGWREARDRAQISLLRDLLDDSLKVRDKLYHHIVNSEDSIGHIYRIIRQLDSVEEEQIYTKAASVTAELLGVRDLAIYVTGKQSHFLRRKVRMGKRAAARPASLDIEKHPYLSELMKTGTVFMNRDFMNDSPDLAAPVMIGDQIIAVIEIYGLSFEQWSYYEENLLSLTSRLIATALSRAARWEELEAGKKYLPGTRILREEPFVRTIETLRARHQELHDSPARLLVLGNMDLPLSSLNERVDHCIRSKDFAGVYKNGYALLFPDTPESALPIIEERLKKAGLSIARSEEVM